MMTILTAYLGASPEDVEQNMTNPIEDELKSITGIKEYNSVSREGNSLILVTLSQDVDDISTTKQGIQNAVDRVRILPTEVVHLPRVISLVLLMVMLKKKPLFVSTQRLYS